MIAATLIFLAAAAPLTMGFFAWDINRWTFLVIVNISALFVIFHTRMAVRWRIIFIAAAFFFFFASFAPSFGGDCRNIHEFIPFLKDLGSIVTSIPRG